MTAPHDPTTWRAQATSCLRWLVFHVRAARLAEVGAVNDGTILVGLVQGGTLALVVCGLVRDVLFDARVRRRKRANDLMAERARLLSVLATRSMQRGPYR